MSGLWTGTSINSTETAMVFNQLWNLTAVEMVRKKNGFLYAILGKMENGATPLDGVSFQRMQKVTGKNIEVKLLGKLKSIPTVADGSAEFTAATPTNTQDYWGAAEFSLAHFKDVHALPESEIDRFAGDELKTSNYLDQVFRMLVLSLEDTWGSSSSSYGGIHDTKAPSRTVLGGWQYAVSDGTTSGESSYATYGTIDRSDSGNADFRSTVTGSVGDLTLAKVQTLQNTIIGKGGMPNIGIAHTTPYTKIQQLVQGYTHVTYEEDWARFGGTWCEFSGIKFILDQRAPSSVLGLIDPETWVWYQRDIDFTKAGVVHVPTYVGSYVLNWGAWVQDICVRPASNGKLTGITS